MLSSRIWFGGKPYTPFCCPIHCTMSAGCLLPLYSTSFWDSSSLNKAGKPYFRVGYLPMPNWLHSLLCSTQSMPNSALGG